MNGFYAGYEMGAGCLCEMCLFEIASDLEGLIMVVKDAGFARKGLKNKFYIL